MHNDPYCVVHTQAHEPGPDRNDDDGVPNVDVCCNVPTMMEFLTSLLFVAKPVRAKSSRNDVATPLSSRVARSRDLKTDGVCGFGGAVVMGSVA
jgi:hypothetical protein